MRACFDAEKSLREGAREVGVDYDPLRSWIRIYEEGVEGFLHKRNQAYRAETKTAGVIDYLR
ncbi:hypothetical protein [Pyramidobacter piscolens]|uniref:hypothetical protein n=1 Tax=Pyramidobacter piscolens TaxID=638849 RepID=UPI0038B8D364